MNTTAAGPAAASAAGVGSGSTAATASLSSSPSSYTRLEALLLFQSVLKYGIDADAFSRIAAVLRENALIRSDASYDASRLSAEALQALFLHILQNSDNPGQPPLSPASASRKRKVPDNANVLLPTLREALARADQLPALIEHLYARYRDDVVHSIREYEVRFSRVQADIQQLEREVAEAEEEERREEQQQQQQQLADTQRDKPVPTPVTAQASTETEVSLPQDAAPIPETPRISAAVATPLPTASSTAPPAASLLTETRQRDTPPGLSSTPVPSKTVPPSPLGQIAPVATTLATPAVPAALGQAQPGQASPAPPQPIQQAARVEERTVVAGPDTVPAVPATRPVVPLPNASLPPPPVFPSNPVEAAIITPRSSQLPTTKPPVATFATAASSRPTLGTPTVPTLNPSNRPLLPAGVQPPPSRTPTPVQSPLPVSAVPHTPAPATQHSVAGFIPRGSGTRWKPSERATATPGPGIGIDDIASPAYEPLSPIQRGAETFATTRQSWQARKAQLATRTSTRPRGGRPSRHGSFTVKDEDVDNNEDDVMDGSPRLLKRKRDESVDFASLSDGGGGLPDRKQHLQAQQQRRRRPAGPPTPPTHVLWTRGFPRISASALDQISSHRHANMFAHKIRDRDAPGYGSIVRHPVDLKSIRMAITQGNKAAIAMAATLPEAEQPAAATSASSSSSMWLPISADLVPPRGIVNSSQLECELMHMFANAVMYNPDSHRGPGAAFMISQEVTEDDMGLAGADGGGSGGASGGYGRYQVDEDGVVNDTRDMYVEVEKLLSEMRSAEKQRGAPPPPADARGLDLPVDEGGQDDREAENCPSDQREDAAADDTADGAAPDADEGAHKRRRITRGQ